MQYDHISQREKTRLKKSDSWWRNIHLKITNIIEFCQDLPSSYIFSREASYEARLWNSVPRRHRSTHRVFRERWVFWPVILCARVVGAVFHPSHVHALLFHTHSSHQGYWRQEPPCYNSGTEPGQIKWDILWQCHCFARFYDKKNTFQIQKI